MEDTPIAQIIAALHALHDDVQQSESRPSADEICARLLAIEALIVALATRGLVVANAALLPQPVPITVDDTPMTIFKLGGKLTATHPRATRKHKE